MTEALFYQGDNVIDPTILYWCKELDTLRNWNQNLIDEHTAHIINGVPLENPVMQSIRKDIALSRTLIGILERREMVKNMRKGGNHAA